MWASQSRGYLALLTVLMVSENIQLVGISQLAVGGVGFRDHGGDQWHVNCSDLVQSLTANSKAHAVSQTSFVFCADCVARFTFWGLLKIWQTKNKDGKHCLFNVNLFLTKADNCSWHAWMPTMTHPEWTNTNYTHSQGKVASWTESKVGLL